jgi:hypothetical protein
MHVEPRRGIIDFDRHAGLTEPADTRHRAHGGRASPSAAIDSDSWRAPSMSTQRVPDLSPSARRTAPGSNSRTGNA